MVAFRDNFPLLQKRDAVFSFTSDWLQLALQVAARKAGYGEWWVAEELTDSVAFYLKFHYPGNVITLQRLEGTIRAILKQVGYSDIAHYFGSKNLPSRVSLFDFAIESKSTGPNDFFHKLKIACDNLPSTDLDIVHFCDLTKCALWLESLSKDQSVINKELLHSCIVLKDKIVATLRNNLADAQSTCSYARFVITD